MLPSEAPEEADYCSPLHRMRPWSPLALPFAMVACSEPTTWTDLFAGTYTATSWTIRQGEETTDALAAGAAIVLSLTSDGRTSGEMRLPAPLSSTGTEQRISLEGTWDLSEGTGHVTFTQQARTSLPAPTGSLGARP